MDWTHTRSRGPNSALYFAMKTFVLVVLSVGALYLWQRQGSETSAPVRPAAAAPVASVSRPEPAHMASQGNWVKSPLDRAHQVADQVRASRSGNEQP
jgi:hypothetical protein